MDNRLQSYVINSFANFSLEEKLQLFYALKNFPEKVTQAITEDIREWALKVSHIHVDPIILTDSDVRQYSQELTDLLINYFSKEMENVELKED